ncbi:MAG: AMP-binding protein, partial [Halobacteria archaeon]|nr:AMP-binding protein [Halobacteria archaeon]
MHLPLLTTEFLDRAVDLHADRVGVVADDGTEYTYGEFGERVNRLSNALEDLGLEKGDRLAILAPNTHWFMESLYAAAKLGVIFVPLNYRLTPSDYNYILNDCEAKAIIADYEYADKIEGIRNQVSTEHHVAYKPDKVKGDWTGYEALLGDYSPDEPQRPDIDETDDASIIYTSGTTGDPKGVVHTYRVQYLHALIHAHHMEVEDDDTILWTSPMFHINGWGHIFTVTGIGGKHVCLRAFDPAEVFRRIPEYDVTFFGAAPTVLNMLIDYYENNDVETQG